MHIEQIQSAIRNGRAVTDVAIEQGVSPSAVYQALHRAETPVSALAPHSKVSVLTSDPGHAGSSRDICRCHSVVRQPSHRGTLPSLARPPHAGRLRWKSLCAVRIIKSRPEAAKPP